MSTESLSPEISALLGRVEAIENDAKVMTVAHSRSRLARLVLFFFLTVAAVVFVYLFMSLAMRFTDSGRQKNFAAVALNQFFEVVDLEKRAQAEGAEDWDQLLNQYSDVLVNEMEDLGKTSMPIVEAAFRKQMNKDSGKHRAMFNEQRDLLVSNLQERGDALLQARYQKILDQHKAILRDEFEDLDDEKMERMLVHLNVAMDRLLRKYYIDEIESQMNRLRGTFDDFAVVDPPSTSETLNQQLLGTSLELLTVKFVGDPIVAVDSPEVLKQGDEGVAAGTDEPAEAAKDSQPEVASDAKLDAPVAADAASSEKQDGPTETTEKEPEDDGQPDSE